MIDKNLGKLCVFITLFALLLIRLFYNGDAKWIQFVSYIGVLIALGDLYAKVYNQNHTKDKFRIIRGGAIILSIALMIVLALMITFFNIGSKGNDILTILALLISLPNDLYCSWINKYINS